MKTEDLITGEIYTVIEYGNIFRYKIGTIADYYLGDNQRSLSTNGGNFNDSCTYRLATSFEKKWLQECIKAGKFIPKELIKCELEYEIY